ncbi:hypothetical protein SEA_FLAPPER_91 [Gordonia phage Flapper]|uniref:Uncharacterized protein n=1 Tax=Gordonia phage Flapper TaxID=2079415 RepID=A0A2L1IXC5_9CAUD|nr:hypothetical protein KNT82_gp91 [Gordonia phage Flapper]AVD99834.1 hypothetical protein SEA_FLAPPER_91 [Gordonia phage Flapper]
MSSTPKRNGPDWITRDADLIGMDVDEYRTATALEAACGPGHAVTYIDRVQSIVRGYIDALLWTQADYSSTDADASEDTTLMDAGYTADDVDADTRGRITAEVMTIITAHPLAVRMYAAQRHYNAGDGNVWEHFGHDFLLTRDGHGAGFWDRGLGDLGDYLTTIAKGYGEHAQMYPDTVGVNGEELLTDGGE